MRYLLLCTVALCSCIGLPTNDKYIVGDDLRDYAIYNHHCTEGLHYSAEECLKAYRAYTEGKKPAPIIQELYLPVNDTAPAWAAAWIDRCHRERPWWSNECCHVAFAAHLEGNVFHTRSVMDSTKNFLCFNQCGEDPNK